MRSLKSSFLIAGFVSVVFLAEAYPPAPHHLVFGTVRDELGNPLAIEDAEVILEAESGVTVKAALNPGFKPGSNYQLSIPMDAGITRDLYRPTAVHPMVPFRIRVRVGDTIYLPIEMRGDLTRLGHPSKKTELDLTLGEDRDGDGLPDAWERALAQNGKTLRDVNPESDDDGDGLSNMDEYIAGSYAFDPNDGFELRMVMSDDGPALEFMSVKGRSYSILGSHNFEEWESVPFLLTGDSGGRPIENYDASDSRLLRVQVTQADSVDDYKFFKVMVR